MKDKENAKDKEEPFVCVLCGAPWPRFLNRCACGGFCTWGLAQGAPPSSWDVTAHGWVPKPLPSREVVPCPHALGEMDQDGDIRCCTGGASIAKEP